MKKFIIINVIMVIISCILLSLIRNSLDDHEVMLKIHDVSDLENIRADLGGCMEYHEGYVIENQYEVLDGKIAGELIVAEVLSTGETELYNYASVQKVRINHVLKGNTSLSQGEEVELVSPGLGLKVHSFYYEDKDTYKRRIERLPEMGYDPAECPDYYSRAWQYRSSLNLMKKDHSYLAFFKEVNVDGLNFFFMPIDLSYFDLTSDYSRPVETSYGHYGDYCDYIGNEMFGDSQEAVDQFYEFKNKILVQYGLR